MPLAVSLGRNASEVTRLVSPSVRPELDVMYFERLHLSRLGVSVPLRSGHFTAPKSLAQLPTIPTPGGHGFPPVRIGGQ